MAHCKAHGENTGVTSAVASLILWQTGSSGSIRFESSPLVKLAVAGIFWSENCYIQRVLAEKIAKDHK